MLTRQLTGGLVCWGVNHCPTLGCQTSTFTTDPTISMHRYSGMGRESVSSYLFRYRGFAIGFSNHKPPVSSRQTPIAVFRDPVESASTQFVTAIGVPVIDLGRYYVKDADGRVLENSDGTQRRNKDVRREDTYVTGINWRDYEAGRFTRFHSRTQQDAMVAIWLDMWLQMSLCYSWSGRSDLLEPRTAFSDEVLRQLESGELIEG